MITDGLSPKVDEAHNGSYTKAAKFLHWTVVALVFVQYLTKLIPPGAFDWLSDDRLDALHVSIGPTVLALMVVRLMWRLTHRAPPSPNDLSPTLKLVSQITHWLLYATLLLLPILGWVAASAYRTTPYLLGLIPLPALVAPDERVGGRLGQVHGMLAWGLLAVIALHVAGALYHAVIRRDGVLGRMLPNRTVS